MKPALLVLAILLAWGNVQAAETAAGDVCREPVSVTVHPEEYVGDTTLTELMSKLIATGRRMAVEQVTTTQVLSKSNETIRNDDIRFASDTSQRFRGTVTSHEILERVPGKIGQRETLRITMRVNVCVTPADQVWYVRIEDIRSEKHGSVNWMKSRFHSPTNQIQLVQSGEARAGEASYKMLGLAFSENITTGYHTNQKEIQKYNSCVQNQRTQARSQRQVLDAFGFGSVGRMIEGMASSGGGPCGDRPQSFAGQRLEAKAIFQIKICDTHSGDCRSVRQPYDFRRLIKTKNDAQAARREFYGEGFGLAGAIALHNLSRSLGMSNQ